MKTPLVYHHRRGWWVRVSVFNLRGPFASLHEALWVAQQYGKPEVRT